MVPNAEALLVQRQIDRIVASRQFVRADRMCHFLRFVIEEWLRNPNGRPKETIVATQVFKRGANYDPATDPVVRVEARRLRAKLEEYYAAEGSQDRVRIRLPKGGYTPVVELRRPRPVRSSVHRWLTAAACMLIALTAVGFGFKRLWRSSGATASVAVLPFRDLTPDHSLSWFSDGFSEQLISALSRSRVMRVAARTSSFHYRDGMAGVGTIGTVLRVDYVVDGSVQRSGDRVRISVQLVAVDTGYTLWARTYERGLDDLFAIQDEITGAVRNALHLRIAPTEPKRPTENREALQLYLKGRQSWYANDFEESATLFKQAVAKDPGFALAFAGLARAYSRIETHDQLMTEAERAASRALEIDETLTEAIIVLASVRLRQWDWPGAEREFRNAIEQNPESAEAHGEYAIGYLAPTGRLDQALKESARSLEIDPLSPIENIRHGVLLTYARRFKEAETQLQKAMALSPEYARRHLGKLYLATGRYRLALELFRNDDLWRAISLVQSGRADEARRIDITKKDVYAALYWAGLEKWDRAFEILDEGRRSHAMALMTFQHPVWDPLRRDPRFNVFLRAIGLPAH